MALVARAEPGAEIYTEQQVFRFGDDGSRQVTQEEAEKLRRYVANGGPLKVEITKARGGK